MADNPTPAPQSGPLPPLPSSGTTGRLKSPTTHLPIKKGGPGKIVVMLSSVAKPPPAGTQALPQVAPSAGAAQVVRRPPPLPPKQVSSGSAPSSSPGRLSTTTYVKMPPKTGDVHGSSLSGAPVPVSEGKESPAGQAAAPPLAAKRGAQHIPPIKLNAPSSEENASDESIFPQAGQPGAAPKPEGWKSLEAGELNPPTGGLQSLEAFARSESVPGKPAPLVAPPLRPPSRVESPGFAGKAGQAFRSLPQPLTPSKPEESFITPPPLHVAPPLLEKTPETPSASFGAPGVPKVPAMLQPEAPVLRPLLPPASPVEKLIKERLKKSTPLVLSSSSPTVELPKAVEAKPALKPAVLPKRMLPMANEGEVSPSTEAPKIAEKSDPAVSSVQPPELILPAQPPEVKAPSPAEKAPPPATLPPAQPSPVAPVSLKAEKPLPPTRAERAKKRRFRGAVVFWVVFVPLTIGALLLGSFYFGQETRVEGQVIPPPGTTLGNDVMIVTDFRELATGIAEDLAAERTPIQQEIQERQDHAQRAQADVASREERIRYINEQIQAAKDEIIATGKQARDATQQIWDGEGAEIDEEYQSRLDQLKKAIADRAKSLNLKYQTDDTYPSPEVWANAYRLALYEVPSGVDSVKEHQWLGDQMKQWRDFLKTLDDRKEQLREKAALIQSSTGPKVADLNTKIGELGQRIDGITAEEAPLKAELQQAQADLTQAQAADAGLDDKYYKQLYALPEEANPKHIPLATNGRFSWVDDDVFAEGEKERHYWVFARATRADGRQYWSLHDFSIHKNQRIELIFEPGGFISTKAILRPNLSPDEQEQ